MSEVRETYLGDGLYASFDGFQFRLRAPRKDGDHFVFLDPATINAFAGYVEKTMKEAMKGMTDGNLPHDFDRSRG